MINTCLSLVSLSPLPSPSSSTPGRFDRSDPSGPNLKLHPLLSLSCGLGPARKYHLHPPPPPLRTPLRAALSSFSNLAYPRRRNVFELLDQSDAAGDLIRPDQAKRRGFEILRSGGGVVAPTCEEALLMFEGEDGWPLGKSG